MNILNFSENIVRLRRKKGITQEELADFVGVTKASVSKWETKQSLPDIVLLPQLATFFNVTVDELLGYEPQLSKEQIQKTYHDLAADFANMPFEDVMEKSENMVKKYYSCYPFLFQICVLWLNHFMMASESKRQLEILTSASNLCTHIISNYNDIGICNDAILLKASIDLQLGKTQEVIDTLEEILNPYRFSNQSDTVLIQAYQLAGQTEKADSFTQMSMFSHLITLVGSAVQYLEIHRNDPDGCQDTINRIDCLIAAFHLDNLHPNTSALFNYQTAIIYCLQQKHQEALKRLDKYASIVCYLLTDNNLFLHGDSYFVLLHKWFEQSDLGLNAPRDKKVILDGAIQALNNPVFSALEQNSTFYRIKNHLKEEGEKL